MEFRPLSTTLEENKKKWQSSVFYTDKDFYEMSNKYLTAYAHVVECAKIYICENWEKVTDWSELNLIVSDNVTTTEYFNAYPKTVKEKPKELSENMKNFLKLVSTEKRSENSNKRKKAREEWLKEKHNPIFSLSNVVLDPTDGDFSIKINGNDHLWIDDRSIIDISHYIEKTLKENVTN